jgi:hypothetical protein
MVHCFPEQNEPLKKFTDDKSSAGLTELDAGSAKAYELVAPKRIKAAQVCILLMMVVMSLIELICAAFLIFLLLKSFSELSLYTTEASRLGPENIALCPRAGKAATFPRSSSYIASNTARIICLGGVSV